MCYHALCDTIYHGGLYLLEAVREASVGGLKYCSMAETWSTCPLDNNGEIEGEEVARGEVEYVENLYKRLKNKTAADLSTDCLDTFKTYYCFGNLPTCEAGRHSMQVCLSACDEVKKKCSRFAGTCHGIATQVPPGKGKWYGTNLDRCRRLETQRNGRTNQRSR